MYENYSRQSLPTKQYRELLGSSIRVFNSNSSFIIENIIREEDTYNWHDLIDIESGRLARIVKSTISKKSNESIAELFDNIVEMRNRIVHSFQITYNEEQILATKTKAKDGNLQFLITEEYLLRFIKLNEELSSLLHKLRGY